MQDDNKTLKDAISAIDSVSNGFKQMQKTMKNMNDNFILHQQITLDTNKLVKNLLIWVVKVLVVALITLAGAKAVIDKFI